LASEQCDFAYGEVIIALHMRVSNVTMCFNRRANMTLGLNELPALQGDSA
jgi:hypothetical protein